MNELFNELNINPEEARFITADELSKALGKLALKRFDLSDVFNNDLSSFEIPDDELLINTASFDGDIELIPSAEAENR